MPKFHRKHISFQAGEVSPLMYGRSDLEFYEKGLSEAYNVYVEKRGGIFRRGGLEHVGREPGNDSRIFTKQIDRFRFDTLFLTDQQMIIIAPGAGFLTPNLISNPSFVDGGTNWTTVATPAGSNVSFNDNSCILEPQQDRVQLVTNGDFEADGFGWSTRTDNQGAVTFSNNQCSLDPRQGVGGAGSFAGIFQSITTPQPGVQHTLFLGYVTNAEFELKIGTGENDGTYLDTVIPAGASVPILFTPAANPFTITMTCLNPQVNTTINNVSIEDPTPLVAGIAQQCTVTAGQGDTHLVRVRQIANKTLTIKIGTTQGATDIGEFQSALAEIDVTFVPNNATFWVQIEAQGEVIDTATLTFVGAVAEADSGGIGFVQAAPWTEEQLPDLHVIEDPTGEVMYFTHPNVQTQKIVYDFASDTYGALTAVAFTGKPAVWTGTNWPATGAFFQGRLWLGGTPNQPQTFWGSVSGSPEDFTVTGGQDSSSLEFTLSKFGRIKWMVGTKSLLIGTENGEHVLTSDGPVITPTDFEIQQQSAYGSNHMQSIQVGEKIFYATPDGRRIQSLAYEWQENNWVSQDLTFSSEHITAGIIQQRAWAQNPGALMFAVLEDGNLAVLTYDRTADTVGWTLFDFQGFSVHDVGVGLVNGVSKMVLTGGRVPGQVDLEATGDQITYMDSYTEQFYALGGNLISGLDHLEGEVVQVTVDGAVDDPQVVTNGSVTTNYSGNLLIAGKQIVSRVTTLPPDVPNESIRSWKKRWNKVWALLYDSNIPIINGVRPPDRTPSTPMNTPEPRRTDHYKTVNLGWDDFGRNTIEENLPVPMNLLAIYGEMEADSL